MKSWPWICCCSIPSKKIINNDEKCYFERVTLSKKDIEIAIDKLFNAAKLLDSYEYPYLNRNKLSYKYRSYEEDNDDVEDYILTSKNPSFST